MANEITLNPYEQVEGELSTEELDSLEVGERLAEQENELLAGKYRSAEELERGYLELQKRLSGKEEPEVEKAPQQEEEVPTEDTGELYDVILESYRTGEWTSEVVNYVEGMHPVDVANMFLSNQQAQQQSTPQATEADIEQIQQAVGGSDEYQSMIQWAGQNLSEQEVAMYDTVMDRGDPIAMFFAAQALNARYQDAVGYDGEMLTGSAPRNTGDAFRSQAELVAAMSDPRYDKDPAYRADVADKLERSNIQF
jgi:aspartokinase